MRRMLLVLGLFAALFASRPAFAYWEYGHETVAAIAWQNMKPQTQRAIRQILAHSAQLETPGCPAATIEQASVWPDCIKKLGPRFSYSSAWHYQDAELCKPFDIKSACAGGNCVSAQIERDIKLLKDKSVPIRERVQALAFLVHFVGDLHQPLHNEDKNGDAGGNGLKASYGIYTADRFNYHSLWDGPLAERAITSGPELVRTYSAAERAPLQSGTVLDWSRESWEAARAAYATVLGGDPCVPSPPQITVTEAEIEAMVPMAREQVLKGGLRLARLLDETFA